MDLLRLQNFSVFSWSTITKNCMLPTHTYYYALWLCGFIIISFIIIIIKIKVNKASVFYFNVLMILTEACDCWQPCWHMTVSLPAVLSLAGAVPVPVQSHPESGEHPGWWEDAPVCWQQRDSPRRLGLCCRESGVPCVTMVTGLHSWGRYFFSPPHETTPSPNQLKRLSSTDGCEAFLEHVPWKFTLGLLWLYNFFFVLFFVNKRLTPSKCFDVSPVNFY